MKPYRISVYKDNKNKYVVQVWDTSKISLVTWATGLLSTKTIGTIIPFLAYVDKIERECWPSYEMDENTIEYINSAISRLQDVLTKLPE